MSPTPAAGSRFSLPLMPNTAITCRFFAPAQEQLHLTIDTNERTCIVGTVHHRRDRQAERDAKLRTAATTTTALRHCAAMLFLQKEQCRRKKKNGRRQLILSIKSHKKLIPTTENKDEGFTISTLALQRSTARSELCESAEKNAKK